MIKRFIAPWNDLAILEGLFRTHPDRIAAVMMEPVLCNSGCLMPGPGYLEGVGISAAGTGRSSSWTR